MIVPEKRDKDLYCQTSLGDVFQFLDEPDNYYIRVAIPGMDCYVNLATGEGFISNSRHSHMQIEILRNAELIINREEF